MTIKTVAYSCYRLKILYFGINVNGESKSEAHFSWDLLKILTLANGLRE